MSIPFPRLATAMLVFAAIVLMTGRSWAVFYGLGPSKDDWGLKYDVTVNDAGSDTLTIVFTLADEGRLKPIYSIDLVAFSKPDRFGGRTYDIKERIELKTTKDGRRAGQVQIRKQFADGAMIRILTLVVDGQRQTAGAAYYDIPLKKFLNKTPAAASPVAESLAAPPSVAVPPAKKITK
jgi:hypothetical protein